MFQIYILSSFKTPRTYVGYTSNLEERIRYHNHGKVNATRPFRPWQILYTENASTMAEAKQRELYWKSGAGRRNMKKILGGSRPTFRNVGRGSLKLKA